MTRRCELAQAQLGDTGAMPLKAEVTEEHRVSHATPKKWTKAHREVNTCAYESAWLVQPQRLNWQADGDTAMCRCSGARSNSSGDAIQVMRAHTM